MSNAYKHPTGRTRTRKAAPDPWGADPLGMLIAGDSHTPLTVFQLEAIAKAVRLWRRYMETAPVDRIIPTAELEALSDASITERLEELERAADELTRFLDGALPGIGDSGEVTP